MNKSAVRKRRRSFTRQFYKGNTSAFALAVLETIILVGANLMISWLMQKLIDVTIKVCIDVYIVLFKQFCQQPTHTAPPFIRLVDQRAPNVT